MTFRDFRPTDASSVSQLIRLTMVRSNSHDYAIDQLQPLIDYFSAEKVSQLNRERTCLVAEENGVIVGTGALEGNHVRTFFVHPQLQRRGIGSALLAMVEEFAVEHRIEQLYIEASKTGVSFYERHGYTRTGRFINSASGSQIEVTKVFTRS